MNGTCLGPLYMKVSSLAFQVNNGRLMLQFCSKQAVSFPKLQVIGSGGV